MCMFADTSIRVAATHKHEHMDACMYRRASALRAQVYVCLGSEILDITELAYCTGLAYDVDGETVLPTDTCNPVLKMATKGGSDNARPSRNKKKRGRRR